MNKKLALLSYQKTNNIGDEIQSIAAKRFLPHVDVYIDRDKISKYTGENVRMILNGWFMNEPLNWPPSNRIEPLIISFHIDPRSYKYLLSEKSIDYFKTKEPIGCRDNDTMEILKKNNVNAYFSGCLTLTLEKKNFEKNNNILLIDIDKETKKNIINNEGFNLEELTNANDYPLIVKIKKILYSVDILRKFTNIPIIIKIKRALITEKLNSAKKIEMAESRLEKYEKAQLVITTRIHAALPCLALGTPVIFILNDKNDKRYKGITELFNCIEYMDVINNKIKIDLNQIPDNPKKYLILRDNLINKCENFLKGSN
jgi:exopolysaccharide biosynthesis predicted pyruvyltransferase EpsI